jgi:hypothetical protein
MKKRFKIFKLYKEEDLNLYKKNNLRIQIVLKQFNNNKTCKYLKLKLRVVAKHEEEGKEEKQGKLALLNKKRLPRVNHYDVEMIGKEIKFRLKI